MHWAEDHILVEVLDPDTLVPVAEGERGELVLTTLRKAARPMIRFRTGDIVSFTSAPCRCGRTSIRMHGVHGRLDDMLIIKGVNIFPSDVEALVRGDDRNTGECRLVVDRFEHLDRRRIKPTELIMAWARPFDQVVWLELLGPFDSPFPIPDAPPPLRVEVPVIAFVILLVVRAHGPQPESGSSTQPGTGGR